jgi:hypothetical protein
MSRKRFAVGTHEWYDHWLSKTWGVSETGAVWINIRGHNVAIIEDYNDSDKYRFRIADREGREYWSAEKFYGIDEAKRPALVDLAEMLGGD